jgi:putative FmdB family regulatory protein
MPSYLYRCEHCHTELEVEQSMNDDPLVDCDDCKQKALRRVIRPASIGFKGSGFYRNDNPTD